jgi:hypothetical protein
MKKPQLPAGLRFLFVLAMMPLIPVDADELCRIDKLDHCDDTNQAMWNGGDKALRAVFGSAEAANEMIELLGGPPEDIVTLPNGWKLLAACRAHDCGADTVVQPFSAKTVPAR